MEGSHYIELIISIVTIVPATIAAVGAWINMTRKKDIQLLEKRNSSLKRELIELYANVNELLLIEKDLCGKLNINPQYNRRNYNTSWRIEPKRVDRRIKDLQS